MITCLPQKFLLEEGPIAKLVGEYNIIPKWHERYGNLVQLRYDQLKSPMGNPLVQQCRGIILDAQQQYRPVAWPFNKFFNHGEPHAATPNIRDSKIYEKLDGSLCILYHYNREWHVATSGMPDASGDVGGFGVSFAELFWTVWKEQQYAFPAEPDLTFMFELTTPYNRVVVRHKQSDLTLIGARNRVTGVEIDPQEFHVLYNTPTEWIFASHDKMQSSFNRVSPIDQEGYVIVDKKFNRVKVKHPGYVRLHHLRDGISPKRIVDALRAGEQSELVAYFPEWKGAFDAIQRAFDELVVHITVEYNRLKDIEVQKDFALEAVKTRCPSVLFSLREGRIADATEGLREMHLETLINLMGVKNIQLI